MYTVPGDKKINDGGFDPVREDVYNVRIEEVKIAEGKEHPKLEMKTVILDPGEFQNRNLWGQVSLSPKAIGFVKQLFDATNCHCEGNSFDEQGLVGQNAKVVAQSYSKRSGGIGIGINQWYPCEEYPCEQKDISVPGELVEEFAAAEDNDLPF